MGRGAVQTRHRADGAFKVGWLEVRFAQGAPRFARGQALARPCQFGGRRNYSGAEWFGQNQMIACRCAAFAEQRSRVGDASDAQAIEWFGIGYRMTTGDSRICLLHFGGAARQDFGHDLGR